MCVICATVGDARPTRTELQQACQSNPDGFGWGAVVHHDDDKFIITGKSMSAVEAINSYEDLLDSWAEHVQASYFHARIATHGSKTLANCHGFEVGGSNGGSVLVHNGVLPIQIAKGDDRTDSQVFAEEILGNMFGGVPGLHANHAWDVCEAYVENSGSKVVVLTVEDEMPLLILGEELGHWQTKEVWWSNSSYKQHVYSPSTVRYSAQDYDLFDDLINVPCANFDCTERLEYDDELCESCQWCQDCVSHWLDCMCLRTGSER